MSYREKSTARSLRRADDGKAQRLLAAARAGSAAAHEALFERQTVWLRAWFQRELPQCLRSKLGPEDLVQEVCLRAWRGLSQFESNSIAAYRGWLEKICRHCLLAVVERHVTALCREVAREVPLDVRAIAHGHQRTLRRACAVEPSEIAAAEAAEEMERLLAGLPPRARQIVVLHACEERSFCEIARELGCCARTVRRDWHRACQELRRRGRTP
ncbi:MAG TPA: sigma-70 family RNA polymerase sigma factor [Pirellulales bacterium]|nr:sigma-70 family RNA polymerase sigma factor [Pirellulales bacterium]